MTKYQYHPCRVLSIQSHVVRGYVGNKAAVFPLQLLGHHVDFINSVHFTSMYIHEGRRSDGAELKVLLDTLTMAQYAPPEGSHPGTIKVVDSSAVADYGYLLTGYVGSTSFFEEILNYVRRQKALRAKFLWLCDPVMGDNGKPYVPIELMDVYREQCIPLADIITPNQYELQWLCQGKSIQTLEEAAQCCRQLHSRGPKAIIVTSLDLPGFDSTLVLLLSHKDLKTNKIEVEAIEFPKLEVYLGGTGDLMSAMLLDGLDRSHNDLRWSCIRAVEILQGVVEHTLKNPTNYDIDVIGSAHIIQNPPKLKNMKIYTVATYLD